MGYQDALREAGIQADEARMRMTSPEHRFHSDDVADGQALLTELVKAGITAVFCYNDMIATGVLMACRDRGIAVPEQLSVVGFDDVEIAAIRHSAAHDDPPAQAAPGGAGSGDAVGSSGGAALSRITYCRPN